MKIIGVNFNQNVATYPALEVVKAFVLKDPMLTPMKVQKLIYFAHGWCLALTGSPLVTELFESSIYGPTIPKVYESLKIFGNGKILVLDHYTSLSEKSLKLVDTILKKYGNLDPLYLSDFAHHTGSPSHQAWIKGPGTIIPNHKIGESFRELING